MAFHFNQEKANKIFMAILLIVSFVIGILMAVMSFFEQLYFPSVVCTITSGICLYYGVNTVLDIVNKQS